VVRPARARQARILYQDETEEGKERRLAALARTAQQLEARDEGRERAPRLRPNLATAPGVSMSRKAAVPCAVAAGEPAPGRDEASRERGGGRPATVTR